MPLKYNPIFESNLIFFSSAIASHWRTLLWLQMMLLQHEGDKGIEWVNDLKRHWSRNSVFGDFLVWYCCIQNSTTLKWLSSLCRWYLIITIVLPRKNLTQHHRPADIFLINLDVQIPRSSRMAIFRADEFEDDDSLDAIQQRQFDKPPPNDLKKFRKKRFSVDQCYF